MEKPKIIINGDKKYIFTGDKTKPVEFIYSEKMEKNFGDVCDFKEEVK